MNPTPPNHPAASTTNLTASGMLIPSAQADLLFRCFYGQGPRAKEIHHEHLTKLISSASSSVWIPFPLVNSLLLCFYGEGQRYHEMSAPLKTPPPPIDPTAPAEPASPKDAPVNLTARVFEETKDLPRTYVPRGSFVKKPPTQEKPPTSA